MSGLAGSMMSGMATGVGFSAANRAMDAIMGPRQTEVVHRHEGGEAPAAAPQAPPAAAPVQAGQCQMQQEQLSQCMSQASSPDQCQYYFDLMKRCQQGI